MNVFVLNEHLTAIDLQDAIDERITQLQAMMQCMDAVEASERPCPLPIIHKAIRCCCAILDEIQVLRTKQIAQHNHVFL